MHQLNASKQPGDKTSWIKQGYEETIPLVASQILNYEKKLYTKLKTSISQQSYPWITNQSINQSIDRIKGLSFIEERVGQNTIIFKAWHERDINFTAQNLDHL